MSNKITKGLCGCWYYLWGHLFALLFYDKKYLRGRWFSGKLNGLCAIGWQWVSKDGLNRMFSLHNREARFPISRDCKVIYPENVEFDPDDLNNFQSFGIYYQAIGGIRIGKGCYIGPNVGLITANHDLDDLDTHTPPQPISLGPACWIGMNTTILPGVTLGPRTVVGAGSVVTHSFPEGNCVVVGNPAKKLRDLPDAPQTASDRCDP